MVISSLILHSRYPFLDPPSWISRFLGFTAKTLESRSDWLKNNKNDKKL